MAQSVVGRRNGRTLRSFLREWFDDSAVMYGQTSGSTGVPKRIVLEKDRMQASARMTCEFLGLHAGMSALLCMPLKYIGAKMVVVRALIAGMNLIAVHPSAHPLRGLQEAPDFAAMTPMQVIGSLEEPAEAALLAAIRENILGGSAVERTLAAKLKTFPHGVWSTYAMTETLSHIALRRLSGAGASDWYVPFPEVKLSLSARGTLCIDAPAICPRVLETNDIVHLDAAGRFIVLGRTDNTVNSGGIKLQIEQIEEMLRPYIAGAYAVTAVPDKVLGEKLVLLAQTLLSAEQMQVIHNALPRYHAPKCCYVATIPLTGSGKIDRRAAKELARQLATHPL